MWSSRDRIKKDEMVGVCRIYGRWKSCNMSNSRRFTQDKQLYVQRVHFLEEKKDKKEWQRAENSNVRYMALHLGATVADNVMKTEYDDWS
jgi:hypothetical protein